MKFHAKWIRACQNMGDVCPVFQRSWNNKKKIKQAELMMTALGVYEANLNGKRVGDYVLAPGWTCYQERLQYQIYDITALLMEENELNVTVGKGWFASPIPGWTGSAGAEDKIRRMNQSIGLFGEIKITYEDNTEELIPTDERWICGESAIRFSEIYDGENFDATYVTEEWKSAEVFEWSSDILIPQEGEIVKEKERVSAKSVFITPAGETVVDFGQEVTGYVEITIVANAGEKIRILHGEMLDEKGNFYNENYRNAKAAIHYTCKDGIQTWHPRLTFFGFRYLKLEGFTGQVSAEQFTAIVVYSDICKIGHLKCSNILLNQLFSNIFWGQKGNFLDVPTDCPQRDERLGWTGDAQVFVKSASYNFDVERFFKKWLHDLAIEQAKDGRVPDVIPDYLQDGHTSAAWGDAAVICPWQIYLTYGDATILKDQFDSMKKWIDYITKTSKENYLWTGSEHFGDWLGLDAPSGSYKGSAREDFIATAFYAYSTSLVIKTGHVLGENIEKYENLYQMIIEKFRKTFTEYHTQTEYVLAVQFELAANLQKTADDLADRIKKDGCKLQTGFVGTPYILHVLSKYGHTELAYTLLLRQEYPSWLYPITKGATTIWEHWDGIMEEGTFWSADMNSFNHYAYGAVADWIYEEAAGIQNIEEMPGFVKVRINPKPDKRLDWLEASIKTRHGLISSRWAWKEDKISYEIETEVPAIIMIGERELEVEPGIYTF